jgi:hypothetical protein
VAKWIRALTIGPPVEGRAKRILLIVLSVVAFVLLIVFTVTNFGDSSIVMRVTVYEGTGPPGSRPSGVFWSGDANLGSSPRAVQGAKVTVLSGVDIEDGAVSSPDAAVRLVGSTNVFGYVRLSRTIHRHDIDVLLKVEKPGYEPVEVVFHHPRDEKASKCLEHDPVVVLAPAR